MAATFRPTMTQQDMQDHNECPSFEDLVSRYPGVKAINDECNRIYPDQLNPLQIQSLIKSWRGGPDPLDYISMFSFEDDYNDSVSSHWHYVSYGLSDLHCDGRLFYPHMFGPDKSGFGIELSFRLKKEFNETSPPIWPAKLMQCLARYVYNSGQPFLPGDHISWHQSMNLDDPNSNKELCQILLTSDPQLQPIRTPAGICEFVQIVPVTTEELLTVQKWSVNAFLDLMRDIPQCGGKFLVTDMSRVQSVFELKPEVEQELIQGILQDGSDLSGVNATVCNWTPDGWKYYDNSNFHYLSEKYQRLYCRHARTAPYSSSRLSEQDKYGHPLSAETPSPTDSDEGQSSDDPESRRGQGNEDNEDNLVASFNSKCRVGPPVELDSKYDQQGSSMRWKKDAAEGGSLGSTPFSSVFAPSVTYYDLMHVTVNLEAGFCLPLALTGRLRHGRHFTFKGITSSTAITLVSPRVQGAFVTEQKPFGAYGGWLQILLSDELVEIMVADLEQLLSTPNVAYPKTFIWPQRNFGLTLVL